MEVEMHGLGGKFAVIRGRFCLRKKSVIVGFKIMIREG